MSSWTWRTWRDRPYLTCDLLAAWPHGFFTRQFAPDGPEVLVQVLDSGAGVYRTQQVHGSAVVSPMAIAAHADRLQADGSFSTAPRQALWTCSADCTPALLGDVHTGQVAAVHAGWRGTAQRILPIAVEKLLAQGSCLENLRVALGPAIAGEVYQVGEDVAAEVSRSLGGFDRLQAMDNSPILPDDEPGRVRLDVRRVNELQLLALGLDWGQVAIAPHCTYQESDYFFSYRRTRQKQVQWSGIVSR